MSSIYAQKQKELLKIKAQHLYEQGLSLRQIGKILDKSHEWVRSAVKETVDNSEKTSK